MCVFQDCAATWIYTCVKEENCYSVQYKEVFLCALGPKSSTEQYDPIKIKTDIHGNEYNSEIIWKYVL